MIMNKVKVSVLEKDYVLQTSENEAYVKRLAHDIDRGIRQIMEGDESLSITSACILFAFDISDGNNKLKTEGDNLRFQIKEYINEAERSNNRAEELERRNGVLETENTALRNKLELYSLKAKLDDSPDEE